jgi:hypothetical protein
MRVWTRYWFAPEPYLNLAVLRIAACFALVFQIAIFHDYAAYLAERFAFVDALYRPILLLRILHAPFGEGFAPPDGLVHALYLVTVAAGVAGLVGLATRVALPVAAAGFAYIQAFVYSFGDFHHPEAVLAVVLGALALAPAGAVLSVDNWLRQRRGLPAADVLQTSAFAGWPVKFVQWFFVLMYLSAAVAKLHFGGLDWMNGYTLQYYLATDGLRWGSELAMWLSQQHLLVMLGQIGVMAFQATFALEVIYPRLRWIYVPLGLLMHTSIYVLLGAPFFVWMALYVVFVPWHLVLARRRGGAGFGLESRA